VVRELDEEGTPRRRRGAAALRCQRSYNYGSDGPTGPEPSLARRIAELVPVKELPGRHTQRLSDISECLRN